ncbi:MAG: efflux RND transporter periplasmic adaptor subunit [Bacteroidetes bacterium]|nr:efflux RND transporter periplasmic adaptor subunit [Bacteroidota bacterium]
MKKLIISSGIALQVFVTACSISGKEEAKGNETFQVMSPIIMDTVYVREYVADIHSLQNVEIRARIRGYIEAIYVDEGKPVKAGQFLFSISPKEYESDLLKAKALRKAAEVEVQSAKTLVDKNVISKTELELAQSKLEEAKANEALAALKLSYAQIKAPFDGIINRIPNKTGSLIDEGSLLTSISDNKQVFAYFNVSEKEYLDFTTMKDSANKNEVTLVLANNQVHKYKGTIETVDGEFDKATGNIAFRARFPNPNLVLKHGSSGKIQVKNELKNAMLVPQKSTFEVQEKTCVYIVNSKNEIEIKTFFPKLRLPYLYVVASGLLSTDKIIYEGVQRVKEGDKIISSPVSIEQALSDH